MTKTKVTLSDVAKAAGISRGAACAALQGGRSSTTGVGPAMVEKVAKVAKHLGYVPNAAARSLRCRHLSQIGVILPNMANGQELASPHSFETIMGINHALLEGGYVLVLARLHDILKPSREVPSSLLFKERMIDVAIAIGQFSEEATKWIAKRMPRTIWCDSQVWSPTCCVRRDEREAGRIAVRGMAEAGLRSVTVLDDPACPLSLHFSFKSRLQGIEEECASLGMKLDHATFGDLVKRDRKALRRAGVLTIPFDMAQRAYVDFCKEGIVPGRDVSLAACDNYRQQWWCFKDIARTDFDRAAMGAAAARMALQYDATGIKPTSALVPSAWKSISGGDTLVRN